MSELQFTKWPENVVIKDLLHVYLANVSCWKNYIYKNWIVKSFKSLLSQLFIRWSKDVLLGNLREAYRLNNLIVLTVMCVSVLTDWWQTATYIAVTNILKWFFISHPLWSCRAAANQWAAWHPYKGYCNVIVQRFHMTTEELHQFVVSVPWQWEKRW